MNNATKYAAYQLRNLMNEGLIASIFTDPNNPDDFIAGYVLAVNQRTTLVHSLTPFGKPDGFFAIRLNAILEIQHDSAYAERLSLLLRLTGQNHPLPQVRDEDDGLVYLLGMASRQGKAVTLWTASESYSGFVTQVNDLFLQMEPVDFLGRRCAPMSFRVADIEMVSLGSEEERMFELLEDHHRKNG